MDLTRRDFLKLGAWVAGVAAASIAVDKVRNEPARERAEDDEEDP